MAIEISEGTSADDVIERLGNPRRTQIVETESEERGVPNWIVEWTYWTTKVTLARREVDGVTCYRVIKVEGRDTNDTD